MLHLCSDSTVGIFTPPCGAHDHYGGFSVSFDVSHGVLELPLGFCEVVISMSGVGIITSHPQNDLVILCQGGFIDFGEHRVCT